MVATHSDNVRALILLEIYLGNPWVRAVLASRGGVDAIFEWPSLKLRRVQHLMVDYLNGGKWKLDGIHRDRVGPQRGPTSTRTKQSPRRNATRRGSSLARSCLGRDVHEGLRLSRKLVASTFAAKKRSKIPQFT